MHMSFDSFNDKIGVVVLDGSMGYELFASGVRYDPKLWSALAITEKKYHALVVDAHLKYLRAGCDVITCNNYSLVPFYLETVGREGEMAALNIISVELANQARRKYCNNSKNARSVYIAVSLPPLSESHRPDKIRHGLLLNV